jgi:hydrogenase maturation protease
MSSGSPSLLLIGFGNPGRLDDGLGPALAARIEQLALEYVVVDADYQLCVEDAAEVAKYPFAIFADAATNGPEPFYLERVVPQSGISFSTHSLDPASVLGLAIDYFGATTRAYVLGIRGYDFNAFGEWLSQEAQHNLEHTVAFLERVLRDRDFDCFEALASKTKQTEA